MKKKTKLVIWVFKMAYLKYFEQRYLMVVSI